MDEEEILRHFLGSWAPTGVDPSAPVKASMRRERRRLRTFSVWPGPDTITPRQLARAGFFYLGPGDRVQCFCCGGVLRCWEPGDKPVAEHQKFFPSCPFVMGIEVGNIPLEEGSDSVDGQILGQLHRFPAGEEEEDDSWQAVYPELVEERQRLSTFHNWPQHTGVTPAQLARAGFFYTGHRDNVKCFHCDGELRNWESGDDPWREHAKWFPRCEFLVQSMGPAYIRAVQDQLISSPESTEESRSASDRSSLSPNDSPGDWREFLQSSIAQGALQMGFDERLVASLVQTRLLVVGTPHSCMSDLIEDLLQAEEDRVRQTPEPARIPEAPSAPRSSNQPQPPKEPAERRKRRSEWWTLAFITPIMCNRAQTSEGLLELLLSTEEQLRRLKEERLCKVCMDKDVSMVFVPCGHLVVCTDCAPNLRHCPICRATIRGCVRAFMS